MIQTSDSMHASSCFTVISACDKHKGYGTCVDSVSMEQAEDEAGGCIAWALVMLRGTAEVPDRLAMEARELPYAMRRSPHREK